VRRERACAGLAEWQTRPTQNRLSERTCGFKSHIRHDVPRRPEARDGSFGRVWIGWLEFDILLGDVHSLKQKRAVIRPLLAELRRLEVSVAEVDDHDLHRRARIGVAVTSGDAAQMTRVLDAAERLVAERPEIELLSARRRLATSDD
jgi:uncharacterized protein YlxP (DUF503 family)